MEIKYVHTEDVHNLNAANEIVPIIMGYFNPKSIIDVGCGIGTWLAVFKKFGVKIKGVDGAYVNKKLLYVSNDEFINADLEKDSLVYLGRYDLAINLEVAEHLNESAADFHLDNLCALSDNIIFSAAIPNQGGQYHVNEQWLEYWTLKFNSRGYILKDTFRAKIWNNNNIDWWYRQNMVVFTKANQGENNDPICSYIHPELFRAKINQITQKNNYINTINDGKLGLKWVLNIMLITLKNKLWKKS